MRQSYKEKRENIYTKFKQQLPLGVKRSHCKRVSIRTEENKHFKKTKNRWYLKIGPLKRWLSSNEVIGIGFNPLWLVVLMRKGNLDTYTVNRTMCAQRKDHMMAQSNGSHVQAKERAEEKRNLLTPWSWTASLQNHEKIHFYGLGHSICGILDSRFKQLIQRYKQKWKTI